MASGQAITNEAITKAVVEATRVAMETIILRHAQII